MPRVFCCFALLVVMMGLCGCADTSSQLPDSVRKIDPLTDYKIGDVDYGPTSEKLFVSSSELIFQGIVLDKSEYSLDDKDILGHKFTRYIGLIKYKITDVLYSLEGNIKTGDEISILTSTTSRRWSKEAIDQIVGQEYILFTRLDTLNEEDDPYRHFFSVTKYILPSPFDAVVSIVDDKAQFYQTFTTLAQRAHPSKRATYKNYTDDCYVMDKQVFVTELKKLIEQYKKPQTTATAATAPVDTDYIKVKPLDEYHVVNASYAQLSERYIIVSSDLVLKVE